MPEFLLSSISGGPELHPVTVLMRLLTALVFGRLVVLAYRWTRPAGTPATSFDGTLLLLCVLIAMVTQVIGDNVARAFSLVGALSIVRFRTVVRDTQDTAFVIFAVVVGMAVGANDPIVATVGLFVVGLAAFLMRRRGGNALVLPYLLHVRIAVGHDVRALLAPALDAHTTSRRMVSIGTGKQGSAIDAVFRASLRDDDTTATALVSDLTRIEAVQSVTLERSDEDD